MYLKLLIFPQKEFQTIVPNFEFINLFVINVRNKSVTQLFFVSTLYTMLRKYGESPFYIVHSSSEFEYQKPNQASVQQHYNVINWGQSWKKKKKKSSSNHSRLSAVAIIWNEGRVSAMQLGLGSMKSLNCRVSGFFTSGDH